MTEQHETMQIGLFWSGELGKDAAELHLSLLEKVFNPLGVQIFLSTQINPGDQWLERIRKEIQKASVGIFLLAPDSLESPWLPYECGQLVALRGFEAIIPLLLGVSQSFADERLPMLRPHHASQFGDAIAFKKLCLTCALDVAKDAQIGDIDKTAEVAWAEHAEQAAALLARATHTVPNPYRGTTKYAAIVESNFSMPGVFSVFRSELFLVGINHAYVLNLKRNRERFIQMIKALLEPGATRRARFLISDLWNKSVVECYRPLVHSLIADAELRDFTESYRNLNSPSYVESVIREDLGDGALTEVREQNLLEVRTYPTILDTFWFIDRGTGEGRCQLSPANATEGMTRPFFFSGEGDQEFIFNYYYSLADTAFSAGGQLWPPREAAQERNDQKM